MEGAYDIISTNILNKYNSSGKPRILVIFAGPPGSGKTTTAVHVVSLINAKVSAISGAKTASRSADESVVPNAESAPFAVAVPMDGFHYPRSHLEKLPNSEEAFKRRGAPWTFDVEAVVALAKKIHKSLNRAPVKREVLMAPGFDHAVKDPVPNAIKISPETNIIILEGNYLLLNEGRWKDISPLADMKFFIDVDEKDARLRVAKRHVKAGVENDMESALKRVDGNDLPNGREVRQKMVSVDLVLRSVNDPAEETEG